MERRPWLIWLLLAAVFGVLRLPSLIEPNWYSDEGTYADIGRALDHGAVLYRDVWDNKPPGIYWLAALVVAVAGPEAPSFHVLLAVLVAAGAVAVWLLGRRFGGMGTAAAATGIFVVLISLPNLDGDLFNAEVVGMVAVLWAMVLLATEEPHPIRSLAAGSLLGVAVVVKPVFAADVAAAAAIPLWVARVRRPAGVPEVRAMLRGVAPMVWGLALCLGAVVVALALGGALGGMLDVLFRQDIDYVQLTTGPGGHVVPPSLAARAIATALLSVRIALPLIAAGGLAWRTSRGADPWVAIGVWWLGCDIAGAVVSARGLTHYAQQAEGSLALVAALAAAGLWRRGGRWRVPGLAVALATWPVIELVLFLPRLEVALANRDPLPPLEHHNFVVAQLGDYYRMSWERLRGEISRPVYEAMFPADVSKIRAVADFFRASSPPRDRVFVWGSIHWVYALSDRLPAARYVSLNDAYYVDPGSQDRLLAELATHPPAVLVGEGNPSPPLASLIARFKYRSSPRSGPGWDAWLLTPPPNRTAACDPR